MNRPAHRLSPGCMIAWAAQDTDTGRTLSIETLRAVMEAAPTYPEAWTYQEGHDFLAAHLAQGVA